MRLNKSSSAFSKSSATAGVSGREIPREIDLTTVQGHPRSSILASMECPYVTLY